MALIFGGKLLAPKQRPANDQDSFNASKSVQLLSKREQELLDELQKTRTDIVKELVRASPQIRTDEIDSWKRSIKQYQSNLSSSKKVERPLTSLEAKKHLRRRSEIQASKTLQSLPIMSSTGEFAFSFKTKRDEPIVLPVLTLPAVRPLQIRSNSVVPQSNSDSQDIISKTSLHSDLIFPYIFDRFDVNFMIHHFSISQQQWDEIMTNFEKVCRHIQPSFEDQDDEILLSVFMSVADRPSDHPFLNDSTTSVRSRSSGLSPLPPIGPSSSQNLKNTMGSSLFASSKQLKARSKKHSGTSRSLSKSRQLPLSQRSVHTASSSSSNDLRQELMTSLAHMQQYTTEVKQSILNVQDIVALSNPRARAFVVSMAADSMCVILTRIGRRELRRGFAAWQLSVKLDLLKLHTSLIRRFLHLRRVAMKLNQLVITTLRFNFTEWVKHCVAERLRVEMEMKSAAAVTIQRVARGNIGREKARKAAEGNKFVKLHRSLVKLQALFRGKLRRWKYLKYRRDILEETSSELIQKVVRGFLGRRRAHRIRSYQSKITAAITIQAAARGRKGRIIASAIRLLRLKNKVIIKIQALARGYIGRMRVATILREKAQNAAALKIQARIRGVVTRMNLHHRRREMEEYRLERTRYAVKIQAVYRGFRARVMFRYYMEEHNQEVAANNKAATKIQSVIRVFLAHRRVSKLQQDRMDRWIADASTWKEIWSDDSGAWFYFNETTEEALWEPPSIGYTKSDGQLVLRNGKVIDPPDPSGKKKRSVGQEHLCVECVKRVAIRRCYECEDNFCTKCYKETHSSGSRKQHTFEAIGPIDCTECEEELAERWCISCDEPYCDSCWRKVHSKGKRRYHPFSQVQEDGNVDARIFTIDGEQIHNYDASYSQSRYEEEMQPSTVTMDESLWTEGDYSQQQDDYSSLEQYGESSEWTSYYDENSVPYWYNSLTGESTYEDPGGGYYE